MRALSCVVFVAVAAFAAANDGGMLFTYNLKRNAPGRHSARDLHRRRLDNLQPLEETHVFGDFKKLAYYYADVYVGTPPKQATVITDTGSSLLAFPCVGCSSCGAHDGNALYNYADSSTAQVINCGGACPFTCSGNMCIYHIGYAEGSSISGQIYEDVVWIGDPSIATVQDGNRYGTRYKFGCHTQETKLFVTQYADGIMGLSQESTSFVSTLMNNGILRNRMFSLCLLYDGGAFILGGMEQRMHQSPIQWSQMGDSRHFYVVTVENVKVDGNGVSGSMSNFNSGQGTIVDSGTTFTYFPRSVFNGVLSAVNSYCSQAGHCKGTKINLDGESICYNLNSASDLSTFPSISIILKGDVELDLSPERLFTNMEWNDGAYCLSVYDNGGSSGVLGANAMMGHDVVFDLHNRKVGFAKSECMLPNSIAFEPSPSETAPVSPTSEPSPSASAPESPTPAASASPLGSHAAAAATVSVAPAVGPSTDASSVASVEASPDASPSPTATESVLPENLPPVTPSAGAVPTTTVDEITPEPMPGSFVPVVLGGVIAFLGTAAGVVCVMNCRGSRSSKGFSVLTTSMDGQEVVSEATESKGSDQSAGGSFRPRYRDNEGATDIEAGTIDRRESRQRRTPGELGPGV